MLTKTFRAHRRRRTAALVTLTALTLLVGAGTAAAHVAVDPSTAAAGDEAVTLTFRVPNESETAGTVAGTVALPANHPFAFASVGQVPGWTVTPTRQTLTTPVTEGDLTIKEAVTSVAWTAQPGNRIGPGEFAEFEISAGPVPDVAALEFPTTQTYDDGTVVEWNERTPAGEEPEHPAPTLTVIPAGDTATGSEVGAASSHSDESAGSTETRTATVSAAASTELSTELSTAQEAGSANSTDSTAVILAVIGIVVAAAALLTAAVALRRRPTTGEK